VAVGADGLLDELPAQDPELWLGSDQFALPADVLEGSLVEQCQALKSKFFHFTESLQAEVVVPFYTSRLPSVFLLSFPPSFRPSVFLLSFLPSFLPSVLPSLYIPF
jgi:hypothetical protein